MNVTTFGTTVFLDRYTVPGYMCIFKIIKDLFL